MLDCLTLLLYPAALLLLATIQPRRVSFCVMLITQVILLLPDGLLALLERPAFSGFHNSLLLLIVWTLLGFVIGWPIAEVIRRALDRYRETITHVITLYQAFRSAIAATLITTLLNLCWQPLSLGWPFASQTFGHWFGMMPTLTLLALCLLLALFRLPKYLRSVFYNQ